MLAERWTKWSKSSLNGIPHWMPHYQTSGPINDCWEANGYYTKAACQDGNCEVDQEQTEPMIPMAYTDTQCSEMILNAKSQDGKICKCNVQSRLPRAEVESYHREYYRLLWSLHATYWLMICHPCLMQLASIVPPQSGHHKCCMQIIVMIQEVDAHIVVQS